MSLGEICADPRDFPALIAAAADPTERMRYARLFGVYRGAVGIQAELDHLFRLLCPQLS
ncbi:hypothetical protein D9M69_728040 [compost metagenome]